ncbi:MAG TPA: orotidine-5'-phosphate decarboxylase [Stellaceae bacterium]|nr:orotidine-5'-phosphate decarboxylase [Stellaceae bacterium]
MSSATHNPILVAIDTTDAEAARATIGRVAPHVGGVKLGLEFFNCHGIEGVARAAGTLPLFLDLKLHDIPNTVAGGVRAVAALKPALLTIHAGGGLAMMKAAVEAARETSPLTKILAVTILTSLDDGDLEALGYRDPVEAQVRRLAALAQQAGVDGCVCSPKEVAALRRQCGVDFLLVVPGIRPAGVALGDQKRVMSPRNAVEAGASYLVIGRPITEASDPAAAAADILASLA